MPTNFISPLDLRTILVNYFLGSQELLAFAFIILFSYGCAKYEMSNKIFGTLLAVCSILLSIHLGEAMYFLTLFIVGMLVSIMFSKLFR